MEKTLLNLIPGACSPEVHLSQYDKGRAVPFKLAEGKSAYSVPDGSEIVVQATKPSGLGFVVPVTFDGDTATMTITETMSNEYGRFPAELSITNNGNRIGTANFVMNIERSPHPEGTIDGDAESLLPELTLLVERIEAAADSVDEDTQTVTEAKAEVLQAKADTLQAKADTLSARDDALQAKADAITAKESAEASAQAAAEASERAEELIGSVSTKADAIVKTASGEIASFTDGGDDLPMKSLKVNIVPKQSGSGDPSPSNVRPISGYEGVNVRRFGKNLLEMAGTSQTVNGVTFTVNADKTITANGTSTAGIVYGLGGTSKLKMGERYILSGCPSGGGVNTYRLAVADPYWNYDYGNGYTFTKQGSANEIRLNISSGVTLNNLIFKPMIRVASDTDDTYEPYNGTSYPISLGQTVYGGTLEVMSGKLTLTKGFVDLGSLDWNLASGTHTNTVFYSTSVQTVIKVPPNNNTMPEIMCSAFKPSKLNDVSAADNVDKAIGIIYHPTNLSARGQLFVSDSRFTTAGAFKSGVNGVQLVYELATPTEIQLTPTEVKTLLGANNIWSDSGTVDVEYRADTTLAYNELLSLIASL